MMMSGGRKALMNPCWETLFIFTGKGYAHQRVSPVNGIQIVEYFSAGCFVLNEENECSALRKTDMAKAYFNCHTDITIPYDELGDIDVIRPDGSEIKLIRQGQFVLEGTQALNEMCKES